MKKEYKQNLLIILGILGLLFIVFIAQFLLPTQQNQTNESSSIKLSLNNIQEVSSNTIDINLNQNTISSESNNVEIKNNTATIIASGVYRVSGQLNNGQIIVNVEDKGSVQIVLNNASIHNNTGSAIAILQANGGTIIQSPENTVNNLSDEDNYLFEKDEDEPNATLFSKDDLVITGSGLLNITANYNDALSSKDSLALWDANININAKDDGIRGKDSLEISNTNLNIIAKDDGIKSDNDNGTDGNILIKSGNISLEVGDDGIHAENNLTIDDGDIKIVKSYEGLEASFITINGGNINITSSDDAINIVANNDESSLQFFGRGPGEQASEGNILVINDGFITINAEGDGLDSNGYIEMHGGNVVVYGPTNNGNGAIDVNGTFFIDNGTVLAIGSAGMSEAPSEESDQYSLQFNFTETYEANTQIKLINESKEIIFETTSLKSFASVVYSSPLLEQNNTYTLIINNQEVANLTTNSILSIYGNTGMRGAPPRRNFNE